MERRLRGGERGSEVAGGERVTIHGAGFESGSRVFFDGQPVPVQDVRAIAGTIEITTPPHAPGAVDVSVENSREVALLPQGFYYRADDAPLITRISPSFGPEAGGQDVFIFGYGFDQPGVEILFDGIDATITEATATWIKVTTPPHAPGAVGVVAPGESSGPSRAGRSESEGFGSL